MLVRRTTALLLVVMAVALMGGAVWPAETPPAGKALTLEEAVAIALRNNPAVEIANQEIKANLGVVLQAESRAYPRLEVSTTRTTPVDQPEFSFQSQGTSWATDFSLTQPLWTWGAVAKGVKAAEELLSSSRKLYVRAQDQVAFAARQAYFGVLTAQEAVKVQYEVLAAAKEQQRIAGLRHEAGVAPKYDVLAAEARVARVEQQVATAAGALSITWANLSRVLGVPLADDTTLSSAQPATAEPPSLAELVAEAQANRPDVLATRALVAANEAGLAVARTGNLPSIGGVISYSLRPKTTISLDTETEVTISQNSGYIALAANWSLFNGGEVFGEVTAAEARLEQSRQGLRQLGLQVESEVKNAYYVIETTRAQVTAAQKEVEQAQEAKRIADLRYQEGVSTSVEVLDAQTQLGDAKNRLIAATSNLSIALAELDLAAGRSLAQALPPGPRTQRDG